MARGTKVKRIVLGKAVEGEAVKERETEKSYMLMLQLMPSHPMNDVALAPVATVDIDITPEEVVVINEMFTVTETETAAAMTMTIKLAEVTKQMMLDFLVEAVDTAPGTVQGTADTRDSRDL